MYAPAARARALGLRLYIARRIRLGRRQLYFWMDVLSSRRPSVYVYARFQRVETLVEVSLLFLHIEYYYDLSL